MIDWLPLLCGVVLLFLGRTLFWVGVGVIGAVIGWQLGLQWLEEVAGAKEDSRTVGPERTFRENYVRAKGWETEPA